ncbi:MAG: methionyl-tRNA formyltransferase [Patescibacteria group bacterium]|nr:methionyl-tRNA formyltransferase [Patescibacteria group bacterium]
MVKIIFIGTSDFARLILERLTRAQAKAGENKEWELAAVFTKSDKSQGRGLKPGSSPVKRLVKSCPNEKIKLVEADNFKSPAEIKKLRQFRPDLIITAAYGALLPPAVLEMARLGCLNIHPSLLPKYRGPSPIQGAILGREKFTGATIIKMNERMDAGEMVARARISVPAGVNFSSLHDKLARVSAKLLLEILPKYIKGKIALKKQDEKKVTYTKLIKKQDGLIDWQEPAAKIQAKISGLNPWPGTFTFFKRQGGKKRRLFVVRAEALEAKLEEAAKHQVGTVIFDKRISADPLVVTGGTDKKSPGDGRKMLRLVAIKPEGKREMKGRDFLNGHKDFIGAKLG